MMKKLKPIIKTLRPTQWIKNFIIFTALVFSGLLFSFDYQMHKFYFWQVFQGFISFCLLASSIYIINDIIDIKSDQKHPVKRKRPIASKQISKRFALLLSFLLISLSFSLAINLRPLFVITEITYLILQIFYSLILKKIPIIDIISIATGFILRVYSGAAIIDINIDVWLLLTITSFSLFLAVGKRRSEKTIAKKLNIQTRNTLKIYNEKLLDQYTSIFATSSWLSYAIFTFQTNLNTYYPAYKRFPYIFILLPRTLQSQKLLMLTVPFVIFGIMRYLLLLYAENKGESPELVILNDKTILLTTFIYALLVFILLYL